MNSKHPGMNANFLSPLRLAVGLLAVAILATAMPDRIRAQTSSARTPAEILTASAEKGNALLATLRNYSYLSELTIQTISQADTITGKFYRFSEMTFDRNGRQQERIIENSSTLPDDVHIGTTAANNLIRAYQFVITPDSLKDYEFNYIGREPVDELNTYVFDVQPKVKLPDPDKSSERYLRGRVWIDEQDLCVVKVVGEALPEQIAHRPSKFETYYQNVERFWFPAFLTADDRIRDGRYWTRVAVKVRFTNYKRATKKE